MIERALAAMLCVLLPFAPLRAQPTSPYLDAAVGLGEWLRDATQDGARWPTAIAKNGSLRFAGSTLGPDTGAAGVGLFALGLHEHTDDARWLALAVKAAEYEHAQHVAGNYNGPDYLSGAAGSGLFLLALHARSGDARYLQWAVDAAQWLETSKIVPVAGQRFWRHSPTHPRTYTGIPHGAAGIAVFQLALYQRTGDTRHLRAAQEAYRWVRTHTLDLDAAGALGFKRLIDDDDVYNWWSGGSAGILPVQGLLYALTSEAEYLADLRRTADGLVLLAEPASPAGVRWTTGSDGAAYSPIVFSHGNASIAPALLLANEYHADPRYLATARASVDWFAAIARDGSENQVEGVFWEHSRNSGFPDLQTTGAFIGTASVGWMFARMHALGGDERLRDLALRSADYLLGVGERLPDGKRRWLSYLGPVDTRWGEQDYALGWYDGNAGIGLFLLAAHEIAVGQRPRLDVHLP